MSIFGYLYEHANMFSLFGDVTDSDKTLFLHWLNRRSLIPPLEELLPFASVLCFLIGRLSSWTLSAGSISVYYISVRPFAPFLEFKTDFQ